MIIFEKVEAQNFLSIGENPIIVALNRSSTTLITGTNGVGKSTILEAICFCLYGKSFRGINKPQLVNTVNQKGCLVKLHFRKGDDQYYILRGIKPNIFSVFKNDVEIDESAAVKDFQLVLEDIIGFSYNDFVKTRMVGNANYKPFLALSGPERRTLVDSLLNLELYTKMQKVHKSIMSALNQDMMSVDKDIDTAMKLWDQAKRNKEHIEGMQSNESSAKQEKLEDMAEKLICLRDHIRSYPDVTEELAQLNEKLGDIFRSRRELDKLLATTNMERKSSSEQSKFWMNARSCDSCSQQISKEHASTKLQEQQAIYHAAVSKVSELDAQLSKLAQEEQETQTRLMEITEKEKEKQLLKTNFTSLKEQAKILKQEIEDTEKFQVSSLEPVTKEIEKYANQIRELSKSKEELQKLYNIRSLATDILKDTGVKAAVIKRFIPMLNKLVNEHLDTMGFGLRCYVDENFSETLKGRFKDEFNYQNLSQGERQRLDLAFLFAWQKIASMSSGVNCNLLLLDEVGDSSLDAVGTDALFQIIENSCQDMNVFIISHRAEMADRCRSKIELYKNSAGFTRIR